MQQTTKYQLNLIEPADEFGPESLNENAQKIEALFEGQLRYVCGTYTGDGRQGKDCPIRIEFDFKPLIVVVVNPDNPEIGGHAWIRGANRVRFHHAGSHMVTSELIWEDRALQWQGYGTAEYMMNVQGTEYRYFAIGIVEQE